MRVDEAVVGTRIVLLVELSGLPAGTNGVIDQDYGTGVMVAWHLPGRGLPKNYRVWDGKWACAPGAPLRDGFDKATELHMLAKVAE